MPNKFSEGQKVIISDGPFRGLDAEVVTYDEKSRRVDISLKILISSNKPSILRISEDYLLIIDTNNRPESINNEAIEILTASKSKIKVVSDYLLDHIKNNPSLIRDLPPNKFEEIVAELLVDMGYEIQLTPKTRDKGRDILAVLTIPPGKKILTIVECKKFSAHRPVGIDLVERFMYTIDNTDRANSGIMVCPLCQASCRLY